MAFIVAVATSFPPYYYRQAELTAMLREFWAAGHSNVNRLEQFHSHMAVNGRYLALPLEAYRKGKVSGLGVSNAAWVKVASDLGETALCTLLAEGAIAAEAIAQLTVTTVTGIAAPSLDARLMNRIPFSPTLKRVPLFGLGCAGGAAGIARVADYLQGHPDEAAILLSVELCSLTFQLDDLSLANVIATGLFGDGAAAVLMVGQAHPLAAAGQPQVVASRSLFFPDTERVMGWDITDRGFKVILSAAVPEIARTRLRPVVESFLAERQLSLGDISHWIVHPGGPKVIQAMTEGLDLPVAALQLSRESLAQIGNVSSASVLIILKETLARYQPQPGTYGLMMAMGPAFCAELVLLKW
jgi:alkylresorcinol/alkylpyrone synthase